MQTVLAIRAKTWLHLRVMSHMASVRYTNSFSDSGCFAPSDSSGASFSGNPLDQVFAFIDLLDAYQPYGGLSRTHVFAAGTRVRCDGHDRLVEDLISSGELIAFTWHDTVWIPMFQFDMLGLEVEPKAHVVVATLGLGCDGWGVANWFVQPNPWLEQHIPIECLGSRMSDVLYAARAHHSVTLR